MADLQSVPVARLGATFRWLLNHGVSSETIGGAFGTSAGNVRVIASRQYEPMSLTQAAPLTAKPSLADKEKLKIRPAFDEVLDTKRRRLALESVREKLAAATEAAQTQYQFEKGVRDLWRILPEVGYPADSRRVDLLGQIHFQISWLLGHLGRSAAAVRHSHYAMDLFRAAWHESGDRSTVDRFVLGGLVQSQSLLLSHQSNAAIEVLDLIADAAASVSSPLGSDHFRQRGIAALQLHEDAQAAAMFKLSDSKMIEFNEAKSQAQLNMTGDRYIHLLGIPHVDNMQELRYLAGSTFGPDGLETSMMTHWVAAAAFSTGSSPLEGEAMELLHENAVTAARFGHQATIGVLLRAIPSLGLYGHLQRKFVRFALYENAFRLR